VSVNSADSFWYRGARLRGAGGTGRATSGLLAGEDPPRRKQERQLAAIYQKKLALAGRGRVVNPDLLEIFASLNY